MLNKNDNLALDLNNKSKSRNSDQMKQIPFKFFIKDDCDIFHGESKERLAFANHYYNDACGSLHLLEDINAYWTMVAKKIIIPMFVEIYDELLSKRYSEDNKLGCFNGRVFYLLGKDPSTKIFVHEMQQGNYLYILEKDGFHIRRIWDIWDDKDKLSWFENKSINDILESLDKLEMYSDDHDQYGKRHSLEYYRQLGFKMEWRDDGSRIYCDMREGGYIFSLNFRERRAPDCLYNFSKLEIITTVFLPSIFDQLNLKYQNTVLSFLNKN